jgi:uncharacterized protein
MRLAIGVMASAPVPGRCKPELLAAYGAEWVAGLYAAMLRDTLDGLNSITAERYIVFADREAAPVLERHVFAPWQIVALEGSTLEEEIGARVENAFRLLLAEADCAVVAGSDAPSFPIDPLASALAEMTTAIPKAIVAPTEGGTTYLLAMNRLESRVVRDVAWNTPALAHTIRARAKEVGLPIVELPPWYAVEAPSDVLRLIDEMRVAPERAPRSAQFLVTHA